MPVVQQIARSATKDGVTLQGLIHHLAQREFAAINTNTANAFDWHHWHVTSVTGGLNNRVFRAQEHKSGQDMAIKFYIRDARDRAGREFAALHRLQQNGLDIAPQPLLLGRFATDQHLAPVVVQTWLAGTVSAIPPDTDAEWQRLLDHLRVVHGIKQRAEWAIAPVVLTMTNAHDGLREIDAQVARLPAEARPVALTELQALAHARIWPTWSPPKLCLCRGDTNTSNFVRRPTGWASIDWEYAGWGDPAFELGDLMSMPPYQDVDGVRWEWVLHHYTADLVDPTFALRVQAYRLLMLIWWVARLARWLYEVPRQLDRRLAQQSGASMPYTQQQQAAKMENYVRRAQSALAEPY